ncbi:uridine kinase family protein [Tomitella biformata]|uniref:uridine kinase family protein n=1 Tax=Tomitella biformata TaxID=630403 RepID=UPI0004AED7C5|nr:hypothetical protein [Tomitella biformata]
MQLIAIDGPSGSGKSMYADRLVERLRQGGAAVALVRTDHFATWARPASWWPSLQECVLEPLLAGRAGAYRPLEWSGTAREWSVRPGSVIGVPVPDILVLEGVTSARRSVADRLDRALWVEWGSEAERLERSVARDGEDYRELLRRWQLFERGWFAVDDTRSRCEVVAGG